MSFDWSSEAPKTIEWAAFFSDCEHEVAQVTSGHRITITYNLYTVSTSIFRQLRSTDIESFPLYHEVKAALSNKRFLPKGGKVGFFCNHFYAQNHDKAPELIPQGLKGIDMIIYAVCHALGLATRLRPIMARDFYTYGCAESDEESDMTVRGDKKKDEEDESHGTGLNSPTREHSTGSKGSATGAGSSGSQLQVEGIPPAKQKISYTRKKEESITDIPHHKFKKSYQLVGRRFQRFDYYNEVVDSDDSDVRGHCPLASCISKLTIDKQHINDLWPHDVRSIYWVTDIRQEEVALAFATVG